MLRLAMRRCVRSIHHASVRAQGGGDATVQVRRVGRVTDGRLQRRVGGEAGIAPVVNGA